MAAETAAKAQAVEPAPGLTFRPKGWVWELVGDLGALLSHPVFLLTMLGATAYIGGCKRPCSYEQSAKVLDDRQAEH